MPEFTKETLREMTKMLKLLDKVGPLYWLAWGVILTAMLFAAAQIIAAWNG